VVVEEESEVEGQTAEQAAAKRERRRKEKFLECLGRDSVDLGPWFVLVILVVSLLTTSILQPSYISSLGQGSLASSGQLPGNFCLSVFFL
jgi:hypothetical protein